MTSEVFQNYKPLAKKPGWCNHTCPGLVNQRRFHEFRLWTCRTTSRLGDDRRQEEGLRTDHLEGKVPHRVTIGIRRIINPMTSKRVRHHIGSPERRTSLMHLK